MINWSEAGHKTARVLLTIGTIIRGILNIIPNLVISLPLTMLGLCLYKILATFVSSISLETCNDILMKLPLILQPGHPWASFCLLWVLISVMGFNFTCYQEFEDEYGRLPIMGLIILNVITFGTLYCMFIIPEETIKWVGWVGLPITWVLTWIMSELSSGGGGGGSSSHDYDNEPKQSKSFWQESRSERREETKPQVYNSEITYRIKVAKQITSNRVDVKVIEYKDGIEQSTGFTWSKTGVLQNWTSDSVVIKDGIIYRQYNIRGSIINSWQERR